ncbi:MAG TPA: hypothetical protein VMX38_22610 [Verrucomicrobiae bacterium]|jgi:hypothetical protein|nr:hypothetical protein [Verrucomicrobiae bacterium]
MRFHAFTYILVAPLLLTYGGLQSDSSIDQIRSEARQHQYDLSTDGKTFLADEAQRASFFLLGELHGEKQIPDLLRQLWPGMWKDGYRYIAAEMSPWAAHQLEFAPDDHENKIVTLWSKDQALFVHSFGTSQAILWGCDIEELQPQLLIRELAKSNPTNQTLAHMAEITKAGYDRKMAPELLASTRKLTSLRDLRINDASLLDNIRATFEVENDRLKPETKFLAQQRRELVMKELFLLHYKEYVPSNAQAKLMLRFGRNHLHRGYDARGISTLGNFIAELAVAEHKTVFNLAAFGAGGKASLLGETWDADERNDDPAFAFLASQARYPATVFDLRPLRSILHGIPADKRSALQQKLVYWADSYDAIICYKSVTPLQSD